MWYPSNHVEVWSKCREAHGHDGQISAVLSKEEISLQHVESLRIFYIFYWNHRGLINIREILAREFLHPGGLSLWQPDCCQVQAGQVFLIQLFLGKPKSRVPLIDPGNVGKLPEF